ncbi:MULTISPECIES: hypothetical protein [unclassified Streptomyces]|uniref:hypothetical protein n=1 Tax=unclassified Streptomyces TaxID=2593676 RepID=UPI0034319859
MSTTQCERPTKSYTRAQLLQALTSCLPAPSGRRARREGEDTTSLWATLAVGGDAASAPEANRPASVTLLRPT